LHATEEKFVRAWMELFKVLRASALMCAILSAKFGASFEPQLLLFQSNVEGEAVASVENQIS